MTTNEILDFLEVNRSIILTLHAQDVAKVKARISNKRSRDRDFLGASTELPRLAYKIIHKDEETDIVKLRVSIRDDDVEVLDIKPAEDL